MPNGGHICCEHCKHTRDVPGKCDIYGILTSPFLLCRMFCMPDTDAEMRRRYPMLNMLEPGTVYEIDNSYPASDVGPVPKYRLREIGKTQQPRVLGTKYAVNIIKKKFGKPGSTVKIPNRRGGTFTATITNGGIDVDNLGPQPFLPWQVFEEAVWLMEKNRGGARLGKAMNAKLGLPDLPFDSIEGHIASQVYGKQSGDSVFRRIVPIANILIWAGICKATPGNLNLI